MMSLLRTVVVVALLLIAAATIWFVVAPYEKWTPAPMKKMSATEISGKLQTMMGELVIVDGGTEHLVLPPVNSLPQGWYLLVCAPQGPCNFVWIHNGKFHVSAKLGPDL